MTRISSKIPHKTGKGPSAPIIGILCNLRSLPDKDGLLTQTTPDSCVEAVRAAGGVPLLVPVSENQDDWAAYLDLFDGILLTGGRSNVHPSHYHGTERPCPPYDLARDKTAFTFIHHALKQNRPLLAICRGAQEVNVAMGGTLYTRVHEIEGRLMHRSDHNAPVKEQFAPAHKVHFSDDGWFQAWGGAKEIIVNSLHSQGVRDLAADLVVEAWAEDGQIEAFRSRNHDFIVAVQWHPEWEMSKDVFSTKLFQRFIKTTQNLCHKT